MSLTKNYLKLLNLVIAGVAICLGTALEPKLDTSPVLAQTQQPNPLEITTPDPLLPQPPVERSLSPLERFRLKEALDELNIQAKIQLQEGNGDEAFNIWYRELRLRRVLGRLEEIPTLGRVGAIAWEQNRKIDTQIITKRLQTVQGEVEEETTFDPLLWEALGLAYEKIRFPQAALEIYEQILANAREEEDSRAQEEVLKTIGKLHLAWLDYPNAAVTYEELLTLARSQLDYFNEQVYLSQLIYIYNQAIQPENALRIKQQLAKNYLQNQEIERLAALKIEIASDYQALNELEKASTNYQEAFTLAWELQQFAAASDALQKLGDLYRSNEQDKFAIQIYQELIKVKQQSYDFYGLMNTYDLIGQIYIKQENYDKALFYFEKGLELAQSLQYQEAYFDEKIQEINEKLE